MEVTWIIRVQQEGIVRQGLVLISPRWTVSALSIRRESESTATDRKRGGVRKHHAHTAILTAMGTVGQRTGIATCGRYLHSGTASQRRSQAIRVGTTTKTSRIGTLVLRSVERLRPGKQVLDLTDSWRWMHLGSGTGFQPES